MIVTFYSFKGGVGRSMALANVGAILAQAGYRVILSDWDLEAPGLERYFATGASQLASIRSQPGLMDLLHEYKETVSKPPPSVPPGEVAPLEHVNVGSYRLRQPASRSQMLPLPGIGGTSVRLLTAGSYGEESFGDYAHAVRSFDWQEFYDQWAGESYIEFFRKDLTAAADIVLIDSRTGTTELGGVCTHHLADLVVMLSAANQLNVEGTRRMANALRSDQLTQLRGGRPIGILPIASRIEQTEGLAQFEKRFLEEFGACVLDAPGGAAAFLHRTEIPYTPPYAFDERLAACEPAATRNRKLYEAYANLAEEIVRWGVSRGLLAERSVERLTQQHTSLVTRATAVAEGDFFLSFQSGDEQAALAVRSGLASAGLRVWSIRDLDLGSSWLGSVDERLRASAGYILLVGKEKDRNWLSAELAAAQRHKLARRDFRVIPLLLDGVDRGSLPLGLVRQQLVTLPPAAKQTPELFARLAAGFEFLGTDSFTYDVCPFPGLRGFDEDWSQFYFGRQAEVREATRLLSLGTADKPSWLQVEGPSGSGKTSFVLGGLVPSLRRELGYAEGSSLAVAIVRPGFEPVIALAQALSVAAFREDRKVSASELAERFARDTNGLRDVLAINARAKGPRVLLVLDQLEELVTLLGRGGKQEQFVDLIVNALDDEATPLYVVTTVRSDFVAELARTLPRLASVLEKRAKRLELAPPTEEQIRQTIVEPAALAGLVWEQGLPERLLQDASGAPGALPLIAHTLRSLWERRTGNVLTHFAYDDLGGVIGALTKGADRILADFDEERRQRARKLLLNLVQVRPDGNVARRPIAAADAERLAGNDDGARAIIGALSGGAGGVPPIIVRSAERVDLVHEALLTRWGTLQGWIDADRAALKKRGELEAATRVWEENNRASDWLPPGARLASFEAYAAGADSASFTPATREFLSQATQRRKKQRYGYGVAASVVLVAGLGVLSGHNDLTAEAKASETKGQLKSIEALLEEKRSFDDCLAAARQLALLNVPTTPDERKRYDDAKGKTDDCVKRDTLARLVDARAKAFASKNMRDEELMCRVEASALRREERFDDPSALLPSSRLIRTLRGGTSTPTSIAFGKTGTLYGASSDGIRAWSPTMSQASPILTFPDRTPTRLMTRFIDGSDRVLAVFQSTKPDDPTSTLALFDPSSAPVRARTYDVTSGLTDAVVLANGTEVIAVGHEGVMFVRFPADGSPARPWVQRLAGDYVRISTNAHGDRAVATGAIGKEHAPGILFGPGATFADDSKSVPFWRQLPAMVVAVNDNASQHAVAFASGKIFTWERIQVLHKEIFNEPHAHVVSLAYCSRPAPAIVAGISGRKDGLSAVARIANGALETTYARSDAAIVDAAMNADCSLVASAWSDNTIRVSTMGEGNPYPVKPQDLAVDLRSRLGYPPTTNDSITCTE